MRWFRKSSDTTEHRYVEERLSAYLDGELTQKERTVVDRHLATCQPCRWNITTLKQTVQWTRDLPAVPVPHVFTIPASAAPARRPRWNWSFVPLLQGATAIVALLLFFVAAGDFLLSGSMLPGAAPEPQMLSLEAPAEDRAAVEMEAAPAGEVPPEAGAEAADVVEIEKEAAPAPQTDAPAEKIAAEPTQPPAAPAAATAPVEGAVPAAESTAGGEADATKAEAPAAAIQATAVKSSASGLRATPTTPLTATYFFTFTTPASRPTRFMSAARTVPTAIVVFSTDAPQARPTLPPVASPTRVLITIPTASAVVIPPTATPAPPTRTTTEPALEPTATLLSAAAALPAATLLPTAAPQTSPPTVVAQAQEPERWNAVEGGNELGAVRQTPAVNWLRVVKLGLAIAFVLLAAITLVAVVRRRQVG